MAAGTGQDASGVKTGEMLKVKSLGFYLQTSQENLCKNNFPLLLGLPGPQQEIKELRLLGGSGSL